MKLHAIYRATGKTNVKPRPAGFSKRRCLESFLRAWEDGGDRGELIFLNDGELPPDMLATMQGAGRVLARANLDLHGSYWGAVRLVERAPWDDGDLLYLAEDDYLYRPEAFSALQAAAAALPTVEYFTLYGSVGREMPNGEPLPSPLRVPAISGERLLDAGGAPWHRALSHTSSFAVRVGALRQDRVLHMIGPRCSAAWDHALCLALQHRAPYGPLRLFDALYERSGAPPVLRMKIVAWRLALTAEALLSHRARRIAAPRPALATHMEQGLMAIGTDWDAL